MSGVAATEHSAFRDLLAVVHRHGDGHVADRFGGSVIQAAKAAQAVVLTERARFDLLFETAMGGSVGDPDAFVAHHFGGDWDKAAQAACELVAELWRLSHVPRPAVPPSPRGTGRP